MATEKNMGVNFIFSVLKTMMGVVFPLITFPYATRVLGPGCLGKIDYAYANVSYFVLIASFGVSSYAIREGSKYRDDREKISKFASEMLCINTVAVLVAYALFVGFMFIPKMSAYRDLMLLFSVTICLTPLGVEWVYNIFEEYRYITVRAFLFQIIAVVILYTCVRDRNDYMIYAGTIILSSVGSNIVNILRLKHYVDFKPVFNKAMLKHIKPMAYLFVMIIASSIYLIMDRTMLGFITGDEREVGLYTTAVKVVTVLTSIIASVRTVVVPRSAYYVKSNPEKSKELNYTTLKIVYLISIPCAIGIALLADRVMVLFAGCEYLESGRVLQILMVDLVFAAANGIIINQIFIINKKEKIASVAIICGAVTNLILNSILIHFIGKYGAAISTCAAEIVILALASIAGRDIFKLEKMVKQIIQSIIASLPMVVLYFVVDNAGIHDLVVIVLMVLVGAVTYFAMLILMKNELLRDLLAGFKISKKNVEQS
ncbi:MAG: flippase [Lachnospiraceae bacterium]|nr:flippase [Lachnospiraceae bacterium]